MVLSGRGVQHCAKGFMTLGWWWQCHEQTPWGTRQHRYMYACRLQDALLVVTVISPLLVDAYRNG